MENDKLYIHHIKNIVQTHPEIKLTYLFGSRATGNIGPMSDFDFAVYAEERDAKKLFELQCALMDEIGRAVKSNNVDIVILNLAESPELKYNIIKDGTLIFEEEPYKVIVEPRILNEYFDFQNLLRKYHLTQT